MYIDIYWEIFNRNTNTLFTGTRYFLILFLAFHRLFSVILENVWDFLGWFSGLAQIFLRMLRFFENLLRNHWNILRNKWNSLRNKWNMLRNKWNFLRNKWNFRETNGTFQGTNGTCWKKIEHFEKKIRLFLGKIRLFLRNFNFLGILPFTLLFAILFAIWTFWAKSGSFWEKPGYFWGKIRANKKKLW